MHCPSRKSELLELYTKSFTRRPWQKFESPRESEVSPLSGRQAAVGLILRENSARGDLDFLLTLRAFDLEYHPGEFCLPGGVVEDADQRHGSFALVHALNRELHEEIGMPLNAIEWEIKPWDTIVSRWGIEAWPHVGFLTEEAPDEFILNNEVARAEWFPLTALFNRENWGRRTLARRGAGRVLQSLPIWEAAEPCVWGMTAAFLSLFLDRVRGEAL